MIAFWTAAVALAVLAWLILVRPGHVRRPDATRAGDANLGLLRAQLAGLDAELARGSIDAAESADARAEIERRVLDEAGVGQPSSASVRHARGLSTGASAGLALGIAAVAFGLYGFLGRPDALTQPAVASSSPAPAADEVSPQAVQAMLDGMARQMAAQPPGSTDASGWTLLARSYAALRRFEDASRAYARAIALTPDDAQLLADQADVLSMLQDGHTAGEPQRLIERALQLDPQNRKAIALAALAAPSDAKETLPSPASKSQGAIHGRITLAPELAARVRPDDTVFVFARAENGPRMPLAIARYRAGDLPLDYRLDDTSAMSPALRLSAHARVVVGARVSRTADATPQPGDPIGRSHAVDTGGGNVDVAIDSVQP